MFDRFNDSLWLAETRNNGMIGNIETLHTTTRLLHALETFSKLPYFMRLWIMQEPVLSKKIIFQSRSREVD